MARRSTWSRCWTSRPQTAGGEQGLLALALHPGFPDNPRFYVHYSNLDGDTRVVEYRAADGGAERVRELLAVDQPYENHNGGQLAFGPDGLLYLGLGDGGGAFDPEGRSQDMGTRLGKLLRLDVDATGTHWEIVANGLRTRGASPSTGRPATSGSATSARTVGRRSTSWPPEPSGR